eukprot:gene22269-27232_t
MLASSKGFSLLRPGSSRLVLSKLYQQSTSAFSSGAAPIVSDHVEFLRKNAKIDVPKRLDTLLKLLSFQGLEFVPPSQRSGLNPLLIPLAKNVTDGSTLSYIRWPTQKEAMDLQIVRTNEVGVTLVSMSTDQYCHRQVVELDFAGNPNVVEAASLLNKDSPLYNIGDYMSMFRSGKFPVNTPAERRLVLDRYLLLKVGAFPDCYERLAENFEAQKNEISALVTCERAVNVFYGYGHPVAFHARLLQRLGRTKEAQDAARSALHLPKWTVAHSRSDLESITQAAGFSNCLVVGEMHAVRARDPREKDQQEGVSPQQISLDQAAHLMDAVALGGVQGGWEAAKKEIAQKYRDGGYPDMANFIEM